MTNTKYIIWLPPAINSPAVIQKIEESFQDIIIMAPITTTTAGISRQIIDDPSLISLLERLRSIVIPMNDDNNDGEDVVMADNDDDHRDEKTEGMIQALVKELVDIPRWRFQEQVRFY